MITALPLLLLAAAQVDLPRGQQNAQQGGGARAIVTASATIISAQRISFQSPEKPTSQQAPRIHTDRQNSKNKNRQITEFY